MTLKELWFGFKHLRPSWQLVLATIVIGWLSRIALILWIALWVLLILWHFRHNPKLKSEVQKMTRLAEEKKAARVRNKDQGGP